MGAVICGHLHIVKASVQLPSLHRPVSYPTVFLRLFYPVSTLLTLFPTESLPLNLNPLHICCWYVSIFNPSVYLSQDFHIRFFLRGFLSVSLIASIVFLMFHSFAPSSVWQVNLPMKQLKINGSPILFYTTLSMCLSIQQKQPRTFMEISKNLEQLKNNDKIKNMFDLTKIINSKWQPKKLKHTLTLSNFGPYPTHGVSRRKKWSCGLCKIIKKENPVFENTNSTVIIKRNFSNNF